MKIAMQGHLITRYPHVAHKCTLDKQLKLIRIRILYKHTLNYFWEVAIAYFKLYMCNYIAN